VQKSGDFYYFLSLVAIDNFQNQIFFGFFHFISLFGEILPIKQKAATYFAANETNGYESVTAR